MLDQPAAIALLLAGVVAIGIGCARLGPIPASGAWVYWVLSTPLARGPLLRGRAWRLLAMAAAPGLALGCVIADGAGARDLSALAIVVLGAAGGVIACSAGVLGQRPSRRRSEVASLVTVLALLAVASGLQLTRFDPVSALWLWSAACAALIGAMVAVAAAITSVPRMGVDRLAEAGAVLASLMTSVAEQSLQTAATTMTDGARRRSNTARSQPLSGTGQSALAALCRRRLRRNRAGLVRFAVAAAIPYLALLIGRDHRWGPAAVACLPRCRRSAGWVTPHADSNSSRIWLPISGSTGGLPGGR